MSQATKPERTGVMADKGLANSTRPIAGQNEVAAFLQDPATHGGQRVERFDTHGAMVFLAGSRAYKVKRAVKFSYMDFSTLAKRREACEREIKLNRRTAPSLYLHTLGVTRASGGGLALGGEGEVVEWAVVMRRFDQADLFGQMAQEGRLTAAHMSDLAEAIACFHAAADPVGADPVGADPVGADPVGADPVGVIKESGGGSDGLTWVIEETLEELAERPEFFAPSDIEELGRAIRSWLARCAPLLDQRRAQGFVRRCHGDLHLWNICLIDGAPTLFDCIEFNDRIACIDVFYDLAFLLMDLEHRGLRPLANLVFNRYLQQTGDFSGPGALAAFLATRALVRAKVIASAEATQEDANQREALREQARSYFKEGAAYLAPAPPCLIAVGGLSGTGKTTLARALAPSLGAAPGAVHLRSDVIRKEIWGAGEYDRLPERAYEPEAAAGVYAAILARAVRALTGGQSVIADAVYAQPCERERPEALARKLSLPFQGLWLSAKSETLVARVEGRTADASDATAAVVRRQLDYETGPVSWHGLGTGGRAEEVLEAALAALKL